MKGKTVREIIYKIKTRRKLFVQTVKDWKNLIQCHVTAVMCLFVIKEIKNKNKNKNKNKHYLKIILTNNFIEVKMNGNKTDDSLNSP